MALAVYRERDGVVLGDRIERADSFWKRFVGLLGRRGLSEGEGLLLEPCRSIHMLFMRFSIDVAFLGPQGEVVRAIHAIRPWRLTRAYLAAVAALELPAGTLARSGTREGDRLLFRARPGRA